MITQIFSQNCIKIITLFSLAPGSRYNRKQIKEKVYMNNIPLDNSLLRLVSSRIFHREKNYYSIDHVNENSKKILDICSKEFKQLKELPLNVYYILMDLSDYFSAAKGVELVLFGSYSKLTYSIKSDIDIAMVYIKRPDRGKIDAFVSKLKKTYNKNLEIHYFEKKPFYKNKKDPLVKSILRDGVRIV